MYQLKTILDNCILKCCIKHGLPLKCLEETQETRNISLHNATHTVMKSVISKECLQYKTIMKECKTTCIEPTTPFHPRGKGEEQRISSTSINNILLKMK